MGYKDPKRQRNFQRHWIRERKKTWIKENGPCANCGSKKDLEIDHVDPTTKISHRVWSWAEERRLLELSKCQVLCSTCHKLKTREQVIQKKHGITRYEQHGCRCDVCREAKSIKNRKRKRKKRRSLAYPPGKS